MKFKISALLLLVVIINVSTCIDVTLPNGIIRGRESKTFSNITFFGFYEVPYAKPPLGNLRFQAPELPNDWEGVLDTTKKTKICYQGQGDSRETEDCLYLNVFTPVLPGGNSSLPVLVNFHGGGFLRGTSGGGVDFLIENDMIVVTVNYRLAQMGFLCTGDLVVPGNAGLKDQVLALKWVNTNIHLFGGDPDKIVIHGQSAGGASVGHHIISKKSTGLFRGAIGESGSSLSPWSFQSDPVTMAYKLAAGIDPTFTNNNSTHELLNVLMNATPEEIYSVSFSDVKQGLGKGYIFCPSLEVQHEGAFHSEHSSVLLENGDFNRVPTIFSINSEEYISKAKDLVSLKNEMTKYDNNLTLIVKQDLNIPDQYKETFGELLRKIYVKGKFQDDLASSVRFHSDTRYVTGVIRHAALQSKYSPVYFSQFSYEGPMGEDSDAIEGAGTVSHSESSKYIWKNNNNQDLSKFPENDVRTHNRMMRLYKNFLHTLNPTPEPDELLQNISWPTVSEDNFHYLDIDVDLTIKKNPKTYKQWKEIIDLYGVPPFDTY